MDTEAISHFQISQCVTSSLEHISDVRPFRRKSDKEAVASLIGCYQELKLIVATSNAEERIRHVYQLEHQLLRASALVDDDNLSCPVLVREYFRLQILGLRNLIDQAQLKGTVSKEFQRALGIVDQKQVTSLIIGLRERA